MSFKYFCRSFGLFTLTVASVSAVAMQNDDSITYGIKAHYSSTKFIKIFPKSLQIGFPKKTYSFGLGLEVVPNHWNWDGFSIYFQTGFDYWHSNHTRANKSLGVFYFVPAFRYTFLQHAAFAPFLEASAGPAVMTNNKLANRNLGIYYTFRDMVGFGGSFCHQHKCAVAVHVYHNSNASISKHNSGMGLFPTFSFAYRL